MRNILTVDVEDWRQLVSWKMTGEKIASSPQVIEETESLLDTLAAHRTHGTFFVLSNVAEAFPDLIRQIDREGHEVGSHGFSHSLVYRQTPEQFRDETRKAKALLEGILGKPIYGYRAAEFSITKQSWWALDILAEVGFTYDSSIYPIAGKRYGIADFPLAPQRIQTDLGRALTEFPLTAVEQWRRRFPVAGGGYFRILPYAVTRAAIRRVNVQNRPAVVYIHPYEFAASALHVPLKGSMFRRGYFAARYTLIHNLGRGRLRRRFDTLLNEFTFAPVREVIECLD